MKSPWGIQSNLLEGSRIGHIGAENHPRILDKSRQLNPERDRPIQSRFEFRARGHDIDGLNPETLRKKCCAGNAIGSAWPTRGCSSFCRRFVHIAFQLLFNSGRLLMRPDLDNPLSPRVIPRRSAGRNCTSRLSTVPSSHRWKSRMIAT